MEVSLCSPPPPLISIPASSASNLANLYKSSLVGVFNLQRNGCKVLHRSLSRVPTFTSPFGLQTPELFDAKRYG
ncbi:hypothetical protein AMTR_s00002p00188420 [Amborella trichopoda]|uniref:Uncharacterized protein n=1 Tax=Amborella trichopoda TaxID=13333 RepID=W1P2A7_AMBTC|nr:hypothetical protein AMTR_s00002p00188420 [Amborella trichopoda]